MTRGCAPLYPGLSHFTPSGLRSRKKVGPSASSGTRLKVGAGHQGGGEHQRIYIRRSIRKGGLKGSKKVVKVRKADPPSAVGGLEDIEKRVGSWGKEKK